ncbi:MAG TPA: hypothetical protein PLA97_23980, partial [Rubrivivax sp.]|nr:hypothetical protein [Rubrivivax sp.]
SLADCADNFLGATLLHTALVDPAGDPGEPPDEALALLLAAQLALDETARGLGAMPLSPLPLPARTLNRSVLR